MSSQPATQVGLPGAVCLRSTVTTVPAVGLRVSRAISPSRDCDGSKIKPTSTSRARARAALGALDREAADAAVLDLLWRRSARPYSSPTPTRASACVSSSASSIEDAAASASASDEPRGRRVCTGSSRARPSRVPDAHASAMIPRRLGAAAASAAPPTGALRGVLLDQSALPTTRVEEDQCSAAPSLSSRPSLRT